jgi:hypothetical protein
MGESCVPYSWRCTCVVLLIKTWDSPSAGADCKYMATHQSLCGLMSNLGVGVTELYCVQDPVIANILWGLMSHIGPRVSEICSVQVTVIPYDQGGHLCFFLTRGFAM